MFRLRSLFLRPDQTCPGRSCARQVKFAAEWRDWSNAQPALGGEHGEDPQFDRAEHDATLRQRRDHSVAFTPSHPSGVPGEALRVEDRELVHRAVAVVGPRPPLISRPRMTLESVQDHS